MLHLFHSLSGEIGEEVGEWLCHRRALGYRTLMQAERAELRLCGFALPFLSLLLSLSSLFALLEPLAKAERLTK